MTGDIGTGKTTVCRRFLKTLSDNTQVAFVLNPCLDSAEFLQAICHELCIKNIDKSATIRELADQIYQCLLDNHANGINTILLVDEAQHIHPNVLEQIRLLTNLETDTQKLLKIVLVGQPELNEVLASPSLKQLSQRITARYHIEPLTLSEVKYYVNHRLGMAGYSQAKPLFSQAIIRRLFELSGGVPRLINIICDRALLGVYSQGLSCVNKKNLEQAYAEIQGNYSFKGYHKTSPNRIRLVLLLSILLLSLFIWKYKAIQQWINHRLTTEVIVEETIVDNKPSVVANIPPEMELEKPITVVLPPEEPKPVISISAYHNVNQGVEAIFTASNIALEVESIRCESLPLVDWHCENVSVKGWRDIQLINRPSLLVLENSNGVQRYLPVIGISGAFAHIVDNGKRYSMTLSTLGEYWTGDIIYLWQAPNNFNRFIYKQSPPIMIRWLSERFALLDNKDHLLADDKYNFRLEKRIKLFQKQLKLKEDGKAGMQTLQKLNEVTGKALLMTNTMFPIVNVIAIEE